MSTVASRYVRQTADRLRLDEFTSTLPPLLKQYPLYATSASLILALSPWLYNNYKAYMALGPGGIPYNAGGWLMALFLKMFQVNTLSTKEHDQDKNKDKFLVDSALPRRSGSRPDSGFHVVPARQLNQQAPSEIKQRLDELMNRMVALNSTLVTFDKSPHEKRNNGVVLHPSISSPHNLADLACREVAHVHPSDHSLHVLLAPQDCKTVISHGWGERHKIAGSKGLWLLPLGVSAHLPKEYIWIYAPRDGSELAAVEKILIASFAYMTGNRVEDIKH